MSLAASTSAPANSNTWQHSTQLVQLNGVLPVLVRAFTAAP